MPNILTPTSLWSDFDDSAEVLAETVSEREEDGIKFEGVRFSGRDAGDGRVRVYGVFASRVDQPAQQTVLIFPDSTDSIDEPLIKLFVKKGYSVFMVDYRGEWDGCENFTEYPASISYANTKKCGRYKQYVDQSADKTSWYEWVAVGIFARKYIAERTGSTDIAVLGLRDGGEIAWKLAVARTFKCIIPVCAVGWLAYLGTSKYMSDEQKLDSERYRFIAGIDSQAYAPYVRCPVLVLCSTNDARFDYDRAFDTFSRINQEYAADSIINYSIQYDGAIDAKGTDDMFMFLDKHLKNHQVFLPQPADITVSVDAEQNLIATVRFDPEGDIIASGAYMAENCIDSSLREWTLCERTERLSNNEYRSYLDVYKDTSTLFVIAYAVYVNGFTVWSKTAVKKISGRFKNTCDKCRVLFSAKRGIDGFCISNANSVAVGGMFFVDENTLPHIVTKAKGVKGIYSEHGLTTYRLNSPKYAPSKEKILKLDIFSDEPSDLVLTIQDANDNQTYKYTQSVLGGVWQSLILESKLFKNENGVPLSDYSHNVRFSISCTGNYAVNNIMWL